MFCRKMVIYVIIEKFFTPIFGKKKKQYLIKTILYE